MVFSRVPTVVTRKRFRKAQRSLRSSLTSSTCRFAPSKWRSLRSTRSKCNARAVGPSRSLLRLRSQEDANFVACRSWPNQSLPIRFSRRAASCRFASRSHRPAQISGSGFHRDGLRQMISNVSRNPKPFTVSICRSGPTTQTRLPTTQASAASITTSLRLTTNATSRDDRSRARDR